MQVQVQVQVAGCRTPESSAHLTWESLRAVLNIVRGSSSPPGSDGIRSPYAGQQE